jgi:protoporphyrinogen oxidase
MRAERPREIAVVGGGVLGLVLGLRLAALGHRLELIEADPVLGGLAAPCDYGEFVWDRFYHCILPQDEHLLALLDELGLGDELRWTSTRTGYWADGTSYPMNNNRDFLRFPLLSLVDKARLAALFVHANRFANPDRLHELTAREWLTRICGRRGYEVFWRPLLKAKFGGLHEQVAAVFIWATIKRLFGARRGLANREKLGYVRGGYRTILGRLEEALRERKGTIHAGTPVLSAEIDEGEGHRRVRLVTERFERSYDQVFFTAPTRLARKIVGPGLEPVVRRVESEHPAARTYLGVICVVLALRRALTPYYVLNIGADDTELTGVIEMTNLIDAREETRGHALVYLPRYLESESPRFEEDDTQALRTLMRGGLERVAPALAEDDVVLHRVHRARFVQPLPVAGESAGGSAAADLPLERPFQVLNTAMLRCATLNNNEVVGLVDRFVARHGPSL